jgi:PIN domain nuclease of toxin-antitoxin system
VRLLLDTHTLLWALADDPKLSKRARETLSAFENEVFVSSASAWEISIKHRLGKLPHATSLVGNIRGIVEQQGFRPLPISIEHADRAGSLPGEHRDPFDRILIAQAQLENLIMISNERLFDSYGVTRIW